MGLPPSNPTGAPEVYRFEVDYPVATILQTQTVEAAIAPVTGYLTSAKVVPIAAVTGANNPSSRAFTIVDPSTRVVTDGIVAVTGTAAFKGPWASGSYAVGDVVTYNNITYVCIATATTEAPTDTTKYQKVDALGLGYLTSRTAAFTRDDIDKTVAGTGFTTAKVLDIVSAITAQVTPNSAVRNALSTTIGASRTLATLSLATGVNLVADTPKALTLDVADTKVYQGDVLKLVSAPDGGTGLADTGGGTAILEITSYGEGS